MIDAGPGIDLAGALRLRGVEELNLVVASHPHADHIGGMRQVLETIPVRFYMDNGQPYTTATYRGAMEAIRARPSITYLEANARTLELGSVRIRILPPFPYRTSNPNDQSVGMVVEYGSFRVFLSGDSERPALDHFQAAGVVPDVTVLKAPHHGADDALSERFLAAARPEVVVISVGYGNSFGHPAASALFAYGRHAEQILRTDLHGEITILGHEDGTYEVIR